MDRGREINLIQILTDENVIRLWASAPNLEELHQIKELTMYVTANLHVSSQLVICEAHGAIAYGDWGVDNLYITLLYKDFSGFDAQPFNLFF